MSSPVMSTTQIAARTTPLPRIAHRLSATHGGTAHRGDLDRALAARLLGHPESRGSVLLIAAILCWILDVLPDYVVALGVIVVWNVAAIGPSAASLSGFASPSGFSFSASSPSAEVWPDPVSSSGSRSPCCRCFQQRSSVRSWHSSSAVC